jgi:hypothetical protein
MERHCQPRSPFTYFLVLGVELSNLQTLRTHLNGLVSIKERELDQVREEEIALRKELRLSEDEQFLDWEDPEE